MQRVSVWYHKDGDHLVVHEVPGWSVFTEWFADRFLCPCCGISGFISRWEKAGGVVYCVWSWVLNLSGKREKILLELPVNGCEVSQKLFGNHSCDICDPEEEEERENTDAGAQ